MATKVIHPLDAPCRCGHPLWLHTTECLALVPGVNQMRSEPCGCNRKASL